MTGIYVALVVCLVLGTALQFVVLPLFYFHRGVNGDWYQFEEIYIPTESNWIGSAGGIISTVLPRNGSLTDRIRYHRLSECPDHSNIPNLNKLTFYELDDSVTMDQAEKIVFGAEALERARRATALADSAIPKLIDKKIWFKTSGRRIMEANLAELEMKIGNYTFIPGGHWRPNHCIPKGKVAIIIPFRNRFHHLSILLRYLVPMLQRQLLEFGIFTVNQENELSFNRATLMNVGFMESLNMSHWDCFVFHDVDHVPLSDLNYYGCSNMPRHFITGDNVWNYTLLYENLFGGVTGFPGSDIRKMNGFPNVYWGWGGEDDEILLRARKANLKIWRRPRGRSRFIGFYKVIEHHHHSAPKIPERYDLLKNYSTRMNYDGLSNLRYPPPRLEIHPLYVNISVDIFRLD
ncbi:beta-1,4-galactosyltransferase 5-like [Acanthaster planci]|uniref:Beta-1,4-galactosyltransferase n=1 Tax=Acanthaster planci TaxID=133434 RepID=A0A8B7Y941_ACAPL|nr:beta-1,4-galactosyltransferase 5-like [Acanthaster planci]XP_022088246.1 beta-1,4-galactosyltransferase 5-like [Acanthaster planci]XP_022088256.1 beta-1,4-galactosyltransferase 5-like [Acanthaster planci]